jgi:hypothetical protein
VKNRVQNLSIYLSIYLCILIFSLFFATQNVWGQSSPIHVVFGDTGQTYTRLLIGEDDWIKVKISCDDPSVYIASLHIALSTRDAYITQRFIDGIINPPLNDWGDRSFLDTNLVPGWTGWTSQALLCFRNYSLAPFLYPFQPSVIAEFKVHVTDNNAIIGDTIPLDSIFRLGWNPENEFMSFGDSLGNNFPNWSWDAHDVIFIVCTDSDQVGTGNGLMPNETHNHIDTYCNQGLNYRMKDISRRLNHDPHYHSGQMLDYASISTEIYASGYYWGSIMEDIDNQWTDVDQRAGVDAQVYSCQVYDFMKEQLQRNGYNGNGLSMVSQVENNQSWVFDDAYWVSNSSISAVIYGAVSTGHRSFAACPDMVGHEWGHAVTQYCSNLRFYGEAGALNESFSDMMGATFTKAKLNDQQWWIIGENYNTSGSPERNMQAPTQQLLPDTYLGQYWHPTSNPDDSGGIHTNCGVPDKMFYLLAAGGTHNGVTVQPIGVENAFKVMYKANTNFWPDSSTFWRARYGSMQASLALDASRQWLTQVGNAWNAVGVCDTCHYVPGDVNGSGQATAADITYLVAWFKGGPGIPYACTLSFIPSLYVTADFNGDCQLTGSDVTYGVAYFKGNQPYIKWCLHFTPQAP